MSQENLKQNPTPKVKRINFVLSRSVYDAADDARKSVGTSTMTSLLKDAFRLYLAALAAEKRGEVLVIKSPDGKNERVLDVKTGIY